VVGVLPGEGVGPEVVECALQVLQNVAESSGVSVELRTGGSIGRDAEKTDGRPLSAEVIEFCEETFVAGGAVLNGPGGGRYVYDLRKRFDLFFKISPLRVRHGAPDAAWLKPAALRGVDILVARENSGGVYQGSWSESLSASGQRLAEHRLTYSEEQVRRFLHAAARLASSRRGDLTVVWKESGVPAVSRLWRDVAADCAAAHGVRFRMVDVDLMAYRLVQEAPTFDVIAAPNLFGDVLADLGAVLLGSRGVSYSGNYSEQGHAVYQTNHGAAYDLAGTDRANPVGQILSAAMMLRESFGLWSQADAVEAAVSALWREGWRTADVQVPSARLVGTREMGRRVAERAAALVRPLRNAA
jgi:3-isopropylmalate dehydrogenase